MDKGLLIRKLRKEKKMKLVDVASALGVQPSTISNWENSIGAPPTTQRIQQLADFFQVAVSFFESSPEASAKPDRDMVEELRATMDFLKNQIDVLNKEKAKLTDLLELALKGNFPEGSSADVPVLLYTGPTPLAA